MAPLLRLGHLYHVKGNQELSCRYYRQCFELKQADGAISDVRSCIKCAMVNVHILIS
jgi:hypothetical protein